MFLVFTRVMNLFCLLGQPDRYKQPKRLPHRQRIFTVLRTSHATSLYQTSPYATDLHYFLLLSWSSIPYTALLLGDIIYYGETTLSGHDFIGYTRVDNERLCVRLKKRNLTRNIDIQQKRV